ncbi:MAG: hypothetical protein H0U65_05635 [Rubrobacter sp.]|jgi:hypothetical protein|nr:hypothetical protein [Rubrobacter sp.]
MTRVVGGAIGRLAKRKEIREREGEPPGDSEEWRRLKRMEERGEVSLGGGSLPDEFWSLPLPEDSTGSVRKAVLEDREENF